MLLAETYVGHRDDESVAAAFDTGDCHRVVLTDTERRRSRVRTETVDGRDIGIVIGRELADGDVLQTEGGASVIVELASVEAMVIELEETDATTTVMVAFGHAVGNRHWEMATRETAVLFPVTDNRERMERFVKEEAPYGVTISYERVPPTTFDDGGPDHAHEPHITDDRVHGDDSHLHIAHHGTEERGDDA
jgi:urease accessory protein